MTQLSLRAFHIGHILIYTYGHTIYINVYNSTAPYSIVIQTMATCGPEGPPSSLYNHFAGLRDGATRGEIDSDTELVPLYDPEESDSDSDDDYSPFYNSRKRTNDGLLRDLTGVTHDSESCKLILDDGATLPSKEISSACKMTIRFKELVGP